MTPQQLDRANLLRHKIERVSGTLTNVRHKGEISGSIAVVNAPVGVSSFRESLPPDAVDEMKALYIRLLTEYLSQLQAEFDAV